MNNFEELKTIKAKLVQYTNHLSGYEGNINPKKVINTINNIIGGN